MPARATIGVCALTFVLASAGCALYDVRPDKSTPNPSPNNGIPFYVKKAGCIQETVRLETVYRLRLEQLAPSPSGSGVRSVTVREALLWQEDLDKVVLELSLLRDALMNTSTKPGEVVKLLDAVAKNKRTTTMTPNQAEGAILVSNRATLKPFVDYLDARYLNVSRPWIGSVNATTEVAGDGTLTKAEAKIEDKTLETFLSLIPVKEVLQKQAGLAPEDSKQFMRLDGGAEITLQFTLEQVSIKHTWTKALPLKGPSLAECQADAPLKATEIGVAYRRETEAKEKEKADEGNTIGITGRITLPKKEDEKKP